ncbi:hypothetical protein MLD38_039796 [Melastoma candidum]|uniref:Uncharacterized protein n=1 Tax=Melastoma candidum TaxID=119954 RepID=A0ACB9L351_9MYRT|nr:hypothetical protein MLD38_039796 [Melastoma candidum]
MSRQAKRVIGPIIYLGRDIRILQGGRTQGNWNRLGRVGDLVGSHLGSWGWRQDRAHGLRCREGSTIHPPVCSASGRNNMLLKAALDRMKNFDLYRHLIDTAKHFHVLFIPPTTQYV